MPYPKPPKQIRWAFAAEKRGELPKGKAREWARKSRAAKHRALERASRKRGR